MSVPLDLVVALSPLTLLGLLRLADAVRARTTQDPSDAPARACFGRGR